MTTMVSALMGFFILSAVSLGQPAAAEGKTDLSATKTAITILASHVVSLTGYNAVPGQTDDDPYTTASGTYSNPEVVAARSVDLADDLPFGTIIAIEPADTSDPNCGYPVVAGRVGIRVIADSMNPRIHNTVDVLFSNHDTVTVGGKERNAANALGICKNVTIKVIGHMKVSDIPQTQNGLVALLENQTADLAVAK